jgi:hypothetical protein
MVVCVKGQAMVPLLDWQKIAIRKARLLRSWCAMTVNAPPKRGGEPEIAIDTGEHHHLASNKLLRDGN